MSKHAQPASSSVSKTPKLLRSSRSRHLIAIGGLFVLVTILFAPFLFSSDKMIYGSDIIGSLDARRAYNEAVAEEHQFPAWFRHRLSGSPSVDASFGDALYPPTFLIQPWFAVHRALGIKMYLHVLLAGVFFYLLLVKGFGITPLVAFAGAAFYMLNPQFISLIYSGHEGKVFVVAWLPFLVWRLKALMGSPGVLNATLLAAGVAMSLLSGHVQLTYFVLWGLFLYWLVGVALRWFEHRTLRSVVPMVTGFWGAIFLGLGMAFVLLYPNVMFVRDAFSVRGVDRGFDFAASWSLHWPEFFSMWVPEFANWLEYYWSQNQFKLNTEYAGAMATLFAVIAVVHKPRPWRIFWAAIAVLALLFALGAHTPLFTLVYHLVPGVKKMRACSMIMFWFSFAAVMLTSVFLGDVAKGELGSLTERSRQRWQRGLLIAIGAFTFLALIFSAKGFVTGLAKAMVPSGFFELPAGRGVTKGEIFEASFEREFVPMLWVWWLFASGALAALWAVVAGKLDRRAFIAIVIGVGLIDLLRIDGGGFSSEGGFIKVVSARPYIRTDSEVERLQAGLENDPFRVLPLPGTFPQNCTGYHGLESVTGFHDNELRWYRDFRGDQTDRNYLAGLVGQRPDGAPYLAVDRIAGGNAFLDLANARYILARQGSELRTFENKRALGRLSFVRDYVVMDTAEIAPALLSGTYDPHETVALLEEPERKPEPQPATDAPAADTATATMQENSDTVASPQPMADTESAAQPPPAMAVTWERYTTNYRRATVDVPAEGFLRVSEVYYPGWEIRIDGEKTRIYQADLAWMAVFIPEGKHTVEMIPRSLYMGTATMVSLPLWSLAIVFWIVAGVRRRRQRQNDA
ncbi:MAG: hypothetical protein GF331_16885 [Chitinivibrionales bacterium]|nr:hypothetical protein [Chitinivibrionales bacterium]